MTVVTIHQAKTQLSELLVRVAEGEEVVIARGKDPVARLVRFEIPEPRRPGRYRGRISLTPDFFDPIPDDELAAWGTD